MDDSAADTEKVKEHRRRLQNDSWDDDENASLSVGNDKKNEWDDDDSTRVIDKAGKKPRRNRWEKKRVQRSHAGTNAGEREGRNDEEHREEEEEEEARVEILRRPRERLRNR